MEPSSTGGLMRRDVPSLLLLAIAAGLLGSGAVSPAPAGAGEDPSRTLVVLGARVRPLKPDGRAWDGDHRKIPPLVYTGLSGAAGFPPLAAVSLVPYRNRPDPYVVVRAKGEELARSATAQGTFLPVWSLVVPLPDALPATLSLEVSDDDLRNDDAVGTATVDVAAMLEKPGLHVVEGTAGLADVEIVLRDPTKGRGPERRVEIRRIAVTARGRRPAGGDWDVGGLPLRDKVPKRLPLPKGAKGLEMRLPDLEIRARWLGGDERVSPPSGNVLSLAWEPEGLGAVGRAGRGDGLALFVVDEDPLLADPVGVVFLPWERFLDAAGEGRLVVEPGETSGLARVEVAFAVGEPREGSAR